MQQNNYKLFEFFDVLPIKKLLKARKLLTSGYFYSEKIGIDLFDFLLKNKKGSNRVFENYEEVFSKITNQPISSNYARMVMSRLQDFLEKFILIDNGLDDPHELLKCLRKNKLDKNYIQLLNQLNRAENPVFNIDSINKNILLNEERINRELVYEKSNNAAIQKYTLIGDQFSNYLFVLSKLKNFITLSNFKKVAGLEFSFLFEEELLKIINSNDFDELEIIKVYKNCYKIQFEDDQQSYLSLKNTILKGTVHIEVEEIKVILGLMNNYCITKINKQHFDYFNELFDLYKFAVNNNLVLEENIISQATYRNFVQTALRVDKIDWAKNFALENKKHLKEDERESAFSYAIAMITFKESNFKETIKFLQKVNFTNFQYDMQARILLAKAYFEEKEFESLDYLVKSTMKFLQRNKLIQDTLRKSYYNFLTVLLRLMDKNEKAQNIKNEINSHQLLAEKVWLTEKNNQK